jgi:3-methyladenine DNA glycosylase/8-oxoguanine DNA glycosylase
VKAIYAPKRFPTPRDILATPPERLRAAGLSTAKTAALRDLARRSLDGTVPTMRRVRVLPDEEVVERLIQVRGVGRWTAEMLLMFRLGRGDVLPVSDLGIRKGFALTFGSRRLPAAITIERRAERWRPYRSVACWYLWRALEQ